MARGLTREIEAEANSRRIPKRRPFGELGNWHQEGLEKRVALPDVTGLTDAVESPAKPEQPRHWRYEGGDGIKESEGMSIIYSSMARTEFRDIARLLNTLTAVQTQLAHLEEQNSISRRRIRELEMELEDCKRDVQRERTRVEEREGVIMRLKMEGQQQREGNGREAKTAERYRQVVEEKKGEHSCTMYIGCLILFHSLGSINRLSSSTSDAAYHGAFFPQAAPRRAEILARFGCQRAERKGHGG
jgi:hypothetical protein